MARAPAHVHTELVRIARMAEGPLILLVPGIHLVPVECHMPPEVRAVRRGSLVAPGGVLGHPLAGAHRPVRRSALEVRGGCVRAALQHLSADIRPWEVVDGQAPN